MGSHLGWVRSKIHVRKRADHDCWSLDNCLLGRVWPGAMRPKLAGGGSHWHWLGNVCLFGRRMFVCLAGEFAKKIASFTNSIR